MTAEALPTITFEEYLDRQQHNERRHEWVAGRVYLMAGGTERHDLMAGLVYEALAPRARSRGCRPFVQNRMVRLGELAYYPDVLVVCPDGLPPERLFERDLSVVVEVLSPSTSSTDRREKVHAYSDAPSFEAYLLVDPDHRRIEVAAPDGSGARGRVRWAVYGPGDLVPHVELDVDGLYDLLDRTAST